MRTEGPRFSAVKFEDRGIKSTSTVSGSKINDEERSINPGVNRFRHYVEESTADSVEQQAAESGLREMQNTCLHERLVT